MTRPGYPSTLRNLRTLDLKAKTFAILAFAILCTPTAKSQIETGTVIVIGYSEQKLVIAADSRQTDGNGSYNDQGCKITALNSNIVFFATGAGMGTEDSGRTIRWSATGEAGAALFNAGRLTEKLYNVFLDELAWSWGVRLSEIVNAAGSELQHSAMNGILVNGFFAGIDERQHLHISHEIIRLDIRNSATASQVTVVKSPSVIMFSSVGASDIVNEFQASETDRSKKWNSQLINYLNKKPTADRDAYRAIWLVDLTEQYGKDRIPKNSSIPLIGGPIDALELTQSGSIRWLQRKDVCADQQK